jgi:hypothetical protein
MAMNDDLFGDRSQEEGSTPEERMVLFKALLDELDERPTELAKRLIDFGDYRSGPTILRSIQRMASGDTAVSGEMLVIVKMLVNQQRQRNQREIALDWQRQPNGGWSVTVDGFIITLRPESKARWSINLVYIKTGYSPSWPAWQPSLEAAKRKAMTCLADGLLEVSELAAGRL